MFALTSHQGSGNQDAVSYRYTPLRMAEIVTTPNAGEEVEELEITHPLPQGM